MDRTIRLLAIGALLASALAVGGCSTSIADLPAVGLPAGAPERPKEAGAYLPVHDLPPDRDEAALPPLLARAGQIEASRFELEFGRLEYWPRARIIAATAAHLPEAALLLARALAAAGFFERLTGLDRLVPVDPRPGTVPAG